MQLLGFDFGLARIGIAVANTLTGIATPKTVIYAKQGKTDWDAIQKEIKVWRPRLLVVGMPQKLDGSDSSMRKPILAFCKKLETLSSSVAKVINHIAILYSYELLAT